MTNAIVKKKEMVGELEKSGWRISALLGSNHKEADRIIHIVRTEIAKAPKLMDCDPASMVKAVLDCVSIGLTPGSLLGEAYLIPYSGQVTLIPGYRGYIKLALQSSFITKIEGRVVYEKETFEVIEGTDSRIIHKPMISGDRGEIVAAYAVAWPRAGGPPQSKAMGMEDINKRRAASRNANGKDSPWVNWFPEMCQKTAVRALSKHLPLGEKFRAAEEIENRAETGKISAALPHETEEDVKRHVVEETKANMKALAAKLSPDEAAEIERQAKMDEENDK